MTGSAARLKSRVSAAAPLARREGVAGAVRHTITLATRGGGYATVSAVSTPHCHVHRALMADGVDGGWTVTHRPSNLAVFRHFDSQSEALRFAWLLEREHAADIALVDPRADGAALRRLADALMGFLGFVWDGFAWRVPAGLALEGAPRMALVEGFGVA